MQALFLLFATPALNLGAVRSASVAGTTSRLVLPNMRLGVPPSDMQGCGGSSPFAPFNGGGSAGDQSKWAAGGQWSAKIEDSAFAPQVNGTSATGSIVPAMKPSERAMSGRETAMQGCGGATPFAPYTGGGSAGDQRKWASGAQWTEKMTR